MAARVDGGVLRRDHVGAEVEDAVDRLVHRALVAGHRCGREDHGVAAVELHLRVVAVRHPPQCGQRLALAAGGDHDHLVVGEILDLPHRHEHPVRNMNVPETAADVHVLAHGPAHERHLAPKR